MIKKEEIKNLSNLARIKVSEKEEKSLESEINSILEYVGQIQQISGKSEEELPILYNVFREDIANHKTGEYTEDLLSLAPQREKNYIKVKKYWDD